MLITAATDAKRWWHHTTLMLRATGDFEIGIVI